MQYKLAATAPWELRLRRACGIALQNHHDWHLLSVSSSRKSDSKYLYLYHNELLAPVRLANHFNYERNSRFYTEIKWDENTSVEDLANSLCQLVIEVDHPYLQFGLKEYLTLQLVASAQLTNGNSRIYIDNAGAIVLKTITYQEFYIQGEEIEDLIYKLRSINLIHIEPDMGHLFLSINGSDFLRAYGTVRKAEWPKSINNLDTDRIISELELHGIHTLNHDELTIRSVMWRLFCKDFVRRKRRRKRHKRYKKWKRLPYDLKSFIKKAEPESPKYWRQQAVIAAFKYLPYGSIIATLVGIPRKRAVYIQFVKDLKLYSICISTNREKLVGYPVADIELKVDSERPEAVQTSFLKLEPLENYSYTKLNTIIYGWLRIVKLSTDYRRIMYWDLKNHEIVIDYPRKQEMIRLSKKYLQWLNVLKKLGWITSENNIYQITGSGRQALHTYYRIASGQKTYWSMKIPTLQLMEVINKQRISGYRFETYGVVDKSKIDTQPK